MLTDIAQWIENCSMSLVMTGLTLQLVCWWAMTKRKLPLTAVIVPMNLSLLLVIAVDIAPFFLPQGGDPLSGLLVVAMFWLIYKENVIFYRNWQKTKHRKAVLDRIAAPMLRLLSRLYGVGALENLDSETPDAKERSLAAALRETLAPTKILERGGVWRLVSGSTPGQNPNSLLLQVAQQTLNARPETDEVPIKTYRLDFAFHDNGRIKTLTVERLSTGKAKLELVPAAGNAAGTYWALRS